MTMRLTMKWASWVDRDYWDGVNWGRMGGWLVCWWGMGNSIIFHISHVAAIASNVSCVVDNLDAAVRKGHLVLPGHDVCVRRLLLVEAGARVVVVDAILESVRLGWLSIAVGWSQWLVNDREWVDWSKRSIGSWWWKDGPGSIG